MNEMPASPGDEKSGFPIPAARLQVPTDVAAPDPDNSAPEPEPRRPSISDSIVRQGEVLPAEPAGTSLPPELAGTSLPPELANDRYTQPAGVLDLIYRMWLSLNWSRTGQVFLLMVAAAVLIGGLGLVAHAVIGTPVLWSTIGGGLTAAGMSATLAARGRRRTQEREAQCGAGQKEGRADQKPR
jgi:hypothetical protein